MYSLVHTIQWLFQVYSWMIIAYILMSWFPQMRGTPVGELLGKVVEPYLMPFRRVIPPIGMIDISPIVALFALNFIELGVITVIGLIGV